MYTGPLEEPSLQKAFNVCILSKLNMTVSVGLLSSPPLCWPCYLRFLVPGHIDTSWLPPGPQNWLLNTPVWLQTHCPSARTKSEMDTDKKEWTPEHWSRQATFRSQWNHSYWDPFYLTKNYWKTWKNGNNKAVCLQSVNLESFKSVT